MTANRLNQSPVSLSTTERSFLLKQDLEKLLESRKDISPKDSPDKNASTTIRQRRGKAFPIPESDGTAKILDGLGMERISRPNDVANIYNQGAWKNLMNVLFPKAIN